MNPSPAVRAGDETHDDTAGAPEPDPPPAGTGTGSGAATGVGPVLVPAVVVLAAVAGALAAGQPTGLTVADAWLRAAFAAAVTVAAAGARRWTWIVLGVAAATCSGASSHLVAGSLALVLAVVGATRRDRQPVTGAAVGALASFVLLRIPPTDPAWLAALIVVPVSSTVAVSAYRDRASAVRRRIRWAVGAVAGAVALTAAGAGIGVARSAGAIEAGIAEARSGVDAAGTGRADVSGDHLRSAASHLAEADAALNAWYVRPSRLVPLLGQQTGALGAMASAAHELALAGAEATATIAHQPVSMEGGRVDLAAVEALAPPLTDVEGSLARAAATSDAIRTDWLVPPIRRRHEQLSDQIGRAHRETTTALDVVRRAPGLLGADGPRRYFLAFTTPAEARGLGGFIGSFAELTADDGRVELTRHDRIIAIQPRRGEPSRPLLAPADYVERYGSTRPQDFLSDATQSPDFPSVAQVIRVSYPEAPGGGPIDGVILADPYAIAAVLRLTGPVRVEGLDEPLTAANAADLLLRRQYELFAKETDDRADVLGEASRQVFDALLAIPEVDPARWARALGPVVAQRRLMLNSARPEEQRLLADLGLDGAFPVPDGPADQQDDFFAITTTNFGNNKIDAYLHRSVDYRADWDPDTGALHAHARVTLRNEAPATGLPSRVIRNRRTARQPDGTNWLALDLYSAHQASNARIRDGGGPAGEGRPLVMGQQRELGRNVYRSHIAVPPGGTVTVDVDLSGTVRRGPDLAVRWFQQPAVHPDPVTVTLQVPDPWVPAPAPGQQIEGTRATRRFTSDRDGRAAFAVSR